MVRKDLRHIATVSKRALRSRRGHDVLMYLLFACVAFVFWFFLSLDNEVQRDFEIPASIDNVPDSVVLIGDAPSRINVVVSGKGSQLLSFEWGHLPELKFKFADIGSNSNVFYLSKARLESRIKDYFGQSVQVISVRPDSIKVPYTTSAGKRLPLKVLTNIRTNLQCVINGPITSNTDSISLYSVNPIPWNLKYVETEPVVLNDIRDTTTVVVALKPIPGVKMIPDKVKVRVPVEPLIAKRRQTQIDVINLPAGVGFLTFPSVVDLNYLVPMSRYNDDYPFKAYVDYNSVNPSSSKVKVSLSPSPAIYHNVSLSVDSVEYVVEKKSTR